MIKTIVWCSIAFLLGGIVAVAYFTFFANANTAKEEKNSNANAKYTMTLNGDNYYSMKTLDSLTAAANFPITSRNKVIRVNADSTKVVKL